MDLEAIREKSIITRKLAESGNKTFVWSYEGRRFTEALGQFLGEKRKCNLL